MQRKKVPTYFLNNGFPPVIRIKQLDTARKIEFVSQDYLLTKNMAARVALKKPSGKIIYNTAQIEKDSIIVNISEQMSVETGRLPLEIEIRENGEYITSFKAFLEVLPKITAEEIPDSENQFGAIEDRLDLLELRSALYQDEGETSFDRKISISGVVDWEDVKNIPLTVRSNKFGESGATTFTVNDLPPKTLNFPRMSGASFFTEPYAGWTKERSVYHVLWDGISLRCIGTGTNDNEIGRRFSAIHLVTDIYQDAGTTMERKVTIPNVSSWDDLLGKPIRIFTNMAGKRGEVTLAVNNLPPKPIFFHFPKDEKAWNFAEDGWVSPLDTYTILAISTQGFLCIDAANYIPTIYNMAERALNQLGGVYDGGDLTVRFEEEIRLNHENNPWKWIQDRIRKRDYTGIYVGDFIPFKADAHDYHAEIAGIDTYKGFSANSLTYGSHIDFICRELWHEKKAQNKVNYNNGVAGTTFAWSATDMYAWLNSSKMSVPNEAKANPALLEVDYTQTGVWGKLPLELRNVIVAKTVYGARRYDETKLLVDDTGNVDSKHMKLWVPAEAEVTGQGAIGTKRYSQVSFTQYPIFANGFSKRVKAMSGTSTKQTWATMTATSGYSGYFVQINSSGFVVGGNTASTPIGVPICFRIA